jgi:signal transduction histidine kinase/ActR/RegA family two-component response regulator
VTPADDVETLRGRLAEALEALEAIRQGDVDALIVRVGDGDQVYTRVTSDEPYRDLVEQMQEGAVVLSVTGDILYCNTRFAKLVGKSLESVIGTRFSRFVDASGSDGFRVLLNARSGRYRCQLIGPDSEAFEVYVSLTTTVAKGVDRLNLIVTDLRELHEAYSSRDRAEQNSRMKDEFLAMLAHELRNPLGAINSGVKLLASTKSGGDTETRAREVIARQVGRLSHLVDDLLDMERVVSGEIQLNRRPFDMAEVVRLAVSSVSDVGLDRQVDVSTELVWVDGDAVRIEQVLTRLMTNAVGHTPPGGRIQVALRGDGDDAVVTIKDAGVGISPGLLPFIFDMFVQGEQDLDRAKGGLGIGLTFVRRLVSLHGGTVVASSDGEGHGSTFTVRLRRIPAAHRPTGLSARPNRVDPRRVLLIEDDRDAREMIRLMLELAGHAVYNAPDGIRGLELMKAERPDVAIIDVGLPGLDGYQVARRIREHLNGRAMLLLALTGYGRPRDYQHSTEAGFDYHLVKPVDLDTLACLLQTGMLPVEAS